jgi:signal transduction histidine kinase
MEPTVAVDTTETVAFANERFYSVSALDRDTTIGADIAVLQAVIAEGFGALREAVRAVLAGDAVDERVELMMVHPAEAPVPRRLPAEARITPLRSGLSDLGALVSIRGIRTRREYERRLERQNERLEEFANVVAHDLRNPLNVAAGRLDLLESDGAHDSEHLETIGDAIDRMWAIVEETLTLAKQGRHVGETEPVPFAEFADRCWRTVETHGATLDVAVDGDTAVLADADRFRHLLENLFRNSVEHGSTGSRSDSHGNSVEHGATSGRTKSGDSVEHGRKNTDRQFVHIRIGVLRDGDDPVGFYVEDDGPGIPADEREQVFEPGYTTDPEGTGYGLPIVTWIAEAHGWTVSATAGTDDGARFEFTGVEFE